MEMVNIYFCLYSVVILLYIRYFNLKNKTLMSLASKKKSKDQNRTNILNKLFLIHILYPYCSFQQQDPI